LNTIILLSLLQININGSNKYQSWNFRDGVRWIVDEFRFDIMERGFILGGQWSFLKPGEGVYFQKRNDLIKKYMGYRGAFDVTLGSFYTTFGRGLLLNATEDEVVLLDRFIEGVNIEGRHPFGSFSLIFGQPKNYVFYELKDSLDLLEGGDLEIEVSPNISIGGSYLRMSTPSIFNTDSLLSTDIFGARLAANSGLFDLYSEFAFRKGWDSYVFEDTTGFAYYGALNIFWGSTVIRGEFKWYDTFGHSYALLPTANHYGANLNDGRDERGGYIGIESPLGDNIVLETGLASSNTSESGAFKNGKIEDKFLSMRYTFTEGMITLSYESILFRNALGLGIIYRRENNPVVDLVFNISDRLGVETRYSMRKREDENTYTDHDGLLTLSFFPYIDLSFAYERRTGDIKDTWRRAELMLKFNENIETEVIYGSQRSDLVCSGGVCRYEPAFDGLKLQVNTRF